MTVVAQLGAARARATDDPALLSPRDVLLDVLEQIDSGEIRALHIMVVTAIDHENGDTQTQVNHAGPYNRHAQYGLLVDALATMQEA